MTPDEIIKAIDAEAVSILKNQYERNPGMYAIVVVRMSQSTFDKAQFEEPRTTRDGACLCWASFVSLPLILGKGMLIMQNKLTLCLHYSNVWPIVIDPDINHGKVLISVWDTKSKKYSPVGAF